MSPYAAMVAIRTVPCESVRSCGSTRPVAPARTAWAYAVSTSGTLRAMSATPSLCLVTCSAPGAPACTAPLSTKRAEPLVSTYSAWSRKPSSGPRYATQVIPNAVE